MQWHIKDLGRAIRAHFKPLKRRPRRGSTESPATLMGKGPKRIGQTAISVLALLVSLTSALFSYLQSRTSSAQLHLIEQQLRPHVTYVPTFFRTKSGLDTDMYLQNQSPLPANVLYTDIAAWIGGEFVSPNLYSIGPDIIYQENGGVSSLPTLKGKPLSRIDKGDDLILATCVIYGSTSKSDHRRWRLQALHKYLPGSSLPKRLFIEEQEASSSESQCSAKEFGKLRGVPIKTVFGGSR
jgi:hypothetical protein